MVNGSDHCLGRCAIVEDAPKLRKGLSFFSPATTISDAASQDDLTMVTADAPVLPPPAAGRACRHTRAV